MKVSKLKADNVCKKKNLEKTKKHAFNKDLTLPAGADGELGLNLGRVQRVILCDQEGLKGGSIHKQRHGGELHVQHIVMPLFVAHLRHTTEGS